MNKYKPSMKHLTQLSEALGMYDDEIENMNDKPVVTSNITISYKGYDAIVIEQKHYDYYWFAYHSGDNCVITVYGKDWNDLKQEYATSIDDYLNWVAQDNN